jgi:hypothetical protein
VIRGPAGTELARLTSDAAGDFAADLPAGSYVIEAQPVTGLMGTPPAQPVTIESGQVTKVDLVYDTGIRAPVMAS